MHVLPPQGHDLAASAPGQHQQPQRRRRVHRKPFLRLQLVQHPAETAELLLRQEALKPARPVLGHEAAGVATRRDQPPCFRLIENARQSADRLVRRGGRHAQTVVQVGDMFAPERGCRQLAKRGQNVLGDHPAISPGRVRLAPHRHMLPEISFREFAHRRPGCRAQPRLQLLPRLDAGQQHRPPPPCLVGGDHPVPTDRNPLRPAGPAALHQIDPGSRAIHPHPEARKIPIPVDDVLALDRQPVDNAVRQRRNRSGPGG